MKLHRFMLLILVLTMVLVSCSKKTTEPLNTTSQMIKVQGGTFNNGASEVTVSTFYINKYELTQTDFESVMGVNPSYFVNVPDGPVENVTWFDAIE
ncbi:MAG: formylglycine-generating enzyme family protein, partial [Candidatus Cloacimonetes bacterium]|nr:formylglycine-generating enzyme family protein [Candidatus Cloacimonadota bacterium]